MDRRTQKKFEKSYVANGGWPGHMTMRWVQTKWEYLYSIGVTAKAAGRMLALDQNNDPEWAAFVVSGQTLSGRTLEHPGIGKLTSMGGNWSGVRFAADTFGCGLRVAQ